MCFFSLLRFFDELFDVIDDDLFLTLRKTPALMPFVTKFKTVETGPIIYVYTNRLALS